MSASRRQQFKWQIRQAGRRNPAVAANLTQRDHPKSRRGVGTRDMREPFAPPEDWYEPREAGGSYRVIVQPAGEGYRHVVTPAEVRQRLAEFPSEFLRGLDVVQFSRITRKKQSFPCYGMQWGTTLYLYPIEESLTEHFAQPPSPLVMNESRMFGGKWTDHGRGQWTLTWTEATIRDFYLNNILIHELGHLLDDRNSSYTDRERYAEWFAIHFGYSRSGGQAARRKQTKVRRRHHAS